MAVSPLVVSSYLYIVAIKKTKKARIWAKFGILLRRQKRLNGRKTPSFLFLFSNPTDGPILKILIFCK